jgi:uncharacterized RDD family membrane protein YckC
VSYPPGPDNPYGQPQQQQPGYGYPQQPPPPQQGYGYPQQGGYDPNAYGGYPQQQPQQPQYGGYPQQPGYPHAGQVQQFYAGWGSRVIARILDSFIVAIPGGILFGIGSAIGKGVGAFVVILGVLVYIGVYLWLVHQKGTRAQSPGMRAVNIQLLREADGQPMGFGMAFVREICHIVDGIPCYIGYLWPLWDAKNQTFADKIMSTVVVKSQ